MAAVAHVTAEPAGCGFLPQPEQQLFYDDAAACLHLVEGRMITAVALPPPVYGDGGRVGAAAGPAASSAGSAPDLAAAGYESDSSISSSTARAFLVSEGPPVRHIRSSLDGAFTALHRSARLVEVHCHATGNMFVETAGSDKQGRKGGDPQLLGFFWTAAHCVMVTAGGLELHAVHPSRQALRLDSTVPLQGVQWYTYSPETHMVVLGFGSSGAKLQAIQFSKAGTLKLPLLDLTPPWGSPIRPAMAATVSAALDGFSAAREQPGRLVGPDTCWVTVLYGRVFACHHDRGAGLLRLYRMFRDATALAHQYEVYARQLELSVVDNMLLVHHIDSAVVMLIDILAPGPAPISSPLPLAVTLAAVEHGQGHGQEHQQHQQLAERPAGGCGGGDPGAAAPGTAAAASRSPMQPGGAPPELVLVGAAAAAAASTLQLHYPSWLVDGAAGVVYRLQLDLAAIADCQSDYPRLLAFLQRRRPATAPRRDAAGITLRVLRLIMQDEAPLGLLRIAFDVVNLFAEDRVAAPQQLQQHSGMAGVGTPQHRHTPRGDVYNSVFALLRAHQQARPCYLQAALAEYVASCCAHGAVVSPSLATLYVELLLDQGLDHLVAPLLLSLPQLGSVELAEHVEEAAAKGRLPLGGQLAEQLLLLLGAHEARCRLLLRQGRPREALLLAQQQGLVGQLAPAALLEAAASSGDAVLFAAAHRVCSAQAQQGALGSLQEAVESHRRFLEPDIQAMKAALA